MWVVIRGEVVYEALDGLVDKLFALDVARILQLASEETLEGPMDRDEASNPTNGSDNKKCEP